MKALGEDLGMVDPTLGYKLEAIFGREALRGITFAITRVEPRVILAIAQSKEGARAIAPGVSFRHPDDPEDTAFGVLLAVCRAIRKLVDHNTAFRIEEKDHRFELIADVIKLYSRGEDGVPTVVPAFALEVVGTLAQEGKAV